MEVPLRNPHSTASIAGHPIHPMLVPFPIAMFIATFACDVVFWRTGNTGWATAAFWLLGAGIVTAALAAVAGLIDFMGDARIRALSHAWQHMIGNVAVVLIELYNLYYRIANGAAAVLPVGLVLSFIVTLLLLFNGWKGWELVYRHRVGIAEAPERRR